MWWLEVELYNDVKIFNNSFLCVVFRSVSHNLLMICRNFGCRCMLYSLILECTAHRCIIIIIITKTMFMAVIMAEPLREFTRSFDECRTVPGGRRPKTKPDDLGCESACTGCQKLHPPSPFIIITRPESWYSFYLPTEGRRLSRPCWLVTYQMVYPSTDGHPSWY